MYQSNDVLPSWTIDWRFPSADEEFSVHWASRRLCKSSDGAPFTLSSVRSSNALVLTGCRLGTIRYIHAGLNLKQPRNERLSQLLSGWSHFANFQMPADLSNIASGARALLRLFFDYFYLYPEEHSPEEELLVWRSWAGRYFPSEYALALEEFAAHTEVEYRYRESAATDSLLVQELVRGRRPHFLGVGKCWLFSLCSGRIGMLESLRPITISNGDLVVIVAGHDQPLILRPTGEGTFTLVAQCVVDGVMYGEAWPNDEALLETFIVV